jgi:hypothetical protein
MEQLRRHLVIPDCQVKPKVALDHLDWCGEYIMKMMPDVVVQIGDFADMPSLCSYDEGKKSFEGRRYKADIEAVQDGMQRLLGPLRQYQKEWEKAKRKGVTRKKYNPRLILTMGNHEDRITRAIEAEPKLEGVLELEDLRYKEWGWEVSPFLQPVMVDGIVYNHYFPTGQMGHPCGTARSILNKYHMSCFAGHMQGRDIAYARKADGGTITAIIAGSFYQHDEAYLNPITNSVWKGIYVLHEVRDGCFDEMPVSMQYLKQRYGK